MTRPVNIMPSWLQCGDTVIFNNKSATVIAIDGPDTHGTYDVHTVDESGQRHIEWVTEQVTIKL